MRTIRKLALATVTAALLMALGAVIASANRVSITEQRFTAKWTELIFENLGITVAKCPVTLEGTFHSTTISKVTGSLIGYITRGTVGTCQTGSATLLQETLPWHVRYNGFTGSLPRFSGIRLLLINASFRVINTSLGINCLARTTATSPAGGIANVTYATPEELIGKVRTLTADNSFSIPCGSLSGRFRGTANVFRGNTTEQTILVTLI